MDPGSVTRGFAVQLPDIGAAVLVLYFVLAYIAFEASGAIPRIATPARRTPWRVLVDRAVFALAFLVLPVAVFAAIRFLGIASDLAAPGAGFLGPGNPLAWLPATLALSGLAAAVGEWAPKGEAELANYPQYLPAWWGPLQVAAEVLSWAAYLFSYEYVFRGALLSLFLPSGGIWLACAVNTGLYALAHLPKGPKESVGCIVFGIGASLLTIAYASIWPAAIIHTALALASDHAAWRRLRLARTQEQGRPKRRPDPSS